MVKLYVVRHCETSANKSGILQGHSSSPISEKGYFQLGLLSHRFKDEKIDAIYSSPIDRAYKTAESINAFHGLEIKCDDRLKEVNLGQMEGKTMTEIAKIFPKEAYIWNTEFENFVAPGGESLREVSVRTKEAIDDIVKENDGKTVVIVAHGGAIKTMLCHLYGYKLEQMAELPILNNTAVSLFEVNEEDVKVVSVNDCDHIPPALKSNSTKNYTFDIQGRA